MKKSKLKITMIIGVLLLCGSIHAQRDYTIKQFTGTYTIDGIANEGFWAQANEIEITSEALSDGNNPACMIADNDDDISAKFKYVYDATHLLIYAEVMDDVVMYQSVTYSCGGSWSVDGIELYFITTNDSTEGQAVGNENSVGGMHFRIQMNEDGSASFPTAGGITDVVYVATNDGYHCEIAIDLAAFLSYRVSTPVVITPGTTIMGFDATVNDSDIPDAASCENCRSALIAWYSRKNALYGDASKAARMHFSSEIATTLPDVSDQSSAVKVFPNPAEKMIYVESEFTLPDVQILNLTGAEVLNVKDYSKGIDVSSLQAGVYILKADNFVLKFTIK
jgi:hypothetical protein